MCGVVVPMVEEVVEPVREIGLGDVGLFGEVEEKADVVLHIQPHNSKTVAGRQAGRHHAMPPGIRSLNDTSSHSVTKKVVRRL